MREGDGTSPRKGGMAGIGRNGLGSGLMAQLMGRCRLWAGRLALPCLEALQDQEHILAPNPTSVETPGFASRSQVRTSQVEWEDSPIMFVVLVGSNHLQGHLLLLHGKN